MGCIEIIELHTNSNVWGWINRNMGCIEMKFVKAEAPADVPINRNMGCIEIPESAGQNNFRSR